MAYDELYKDGLLKIYGPVKGTIEERMASFRSIWDGKDEESAFRELIFCLLTPQSKALTCWGAVEDLTCDDGLLSSNYNEVLGAVSNVRFKYKKAHYIIGARELVRKDDGTNVLGMLSKLDGPIEAREWLVRNVKGLGYKEASHFLRNIGFGEDLAILDRHILKNLKAAGVIDEVPAHLNRTNYLRIEGLMRAYAAHTGIPMPHLDLLLWYKEAGSVFK